MATLTRNLPNRVLAKAKFLSSYIARARKHLRFPRAFSATQLKLVGAANEAHLIYVDEEVGGYSRQKKHLKFVYLDAGGRRIRDRKVIERINKLAIPPAYTDVWICPHERGHIQATGRDARGRKQYRYHEEWRSVRDANKYERVTEFVHALPKIRKATETHLAGPGLSREKVLAAVVQLLEKTFIRIGNEEYARENASFGLTTLRTRHVEVSGSKIHFEFRGKSKVDHVLDISDRKLAKIIRNCQELPGQELFQFVDDQGARHKVGSDEVNSYLQEITGQPFTAKDFRTWAGTMMAILAFRHVGGFKSERQSKQKLNIAVKAVAHRLGNTAAICRKCYIHPAVLESFLAQEHLKEGDEEAQNYEFEALANKVEALMSELTHSQMEHEILGLLQHWEKRATRSSRKLA